MEEMKDLDMFILMKEAERVSKAENDKFKLLPRMANASRFQLGALISQSFAERMNSCGKQIVSDNRGKLDNDMIDKLVVLCMNREFMEFVRLRQTKSKVASKN